jgi:hypothetical protein
MPAGSCPYSVRFECDLQHIVCQAAPGRGSRSARTELSRRVRECAPSALMASSKPYIFDFCVSVSPPPRPDQAHFRWPLALPSLRLGHGPSRRWRRRRRRGRKARTGSSDCSIPGASLVGSKTEFCQRISSGERPEIVSCPAGRGAILGPGPRGVVGRVVWCGELEDVPQELWCRVPAAAVVIDDEQKPNFWTGCSSTPNSAILKRPDQQKR